MVPTGRLCITPTRDRRLNPLTPGSYAALVHIDDLTETLLAVAYAIEPQSRIGQIDSEADFDTPLGQST